MKIVVVGATGLVGTQMLKVLAERNFPVTELILVASERSIGNSVFFKDKKHTIVGLETAVQLEADIAIFSAGGETSLQWAPKFAARGTTVIDNSSAWRMDPSKKLIVPEINADELSENDKIIANPNCSTIQLVVALADLHRQLGIDRIVVSTYQSVTGTGKSAVDQMENERNGIEGIKAYPYQIDKNVLPHIDVFQENGYTKEEIKMMQETKKIFGDEGIKVTATCVRIPTVGGHSESINVTFKKAFELDQIRNILEHTEGVIVQDDPKNLLYPMPINAHEKDQVFVGRLRLDETAPNCINLWVVSDNLRKGAATNAVQIAEYLVKAHLV
ncbi:MAG: aspartate-semialdehyde dehydrogenase [Cyclobacteriaceae bacterium]|jgi:aspartate-semialdehyde dehydrogenase